MILHGNQTLAPCPSSVIKFDSAMILHGNQTGIILGPRRLRLTGLITFIFFLKRTLSFDLVAGVKGAQHPLGEASTLHRNLH